MSTRVLRIDSSLFSENGASTQLNDTLMAQLEQAHGPLTVTHRDLALDPLPHFSADLIVGLGVAAEQRTAEQNKLVALADTLIQELLDTDILVIGAPMYNFGIPSTLKAWIDFVARAGTTFRYTSAGPEGLVKGKTAFITTTRGGVYKDQPSDLEIPFLKTYLSFLGIDDIRVVYAEGLNMGQKEQSFVAAKQSIEQVVAA